MQDRFGVLLIQLVKWLLFILHGNDIYIFIKWAQLHVQIDGFESIFHVVLNNLIVGFDCQIVFAKFP
jgi:hypothetical protein